MHRLVAVPASLVSSLRTEDRARLDEAVRMILPVSARRLGVLNEGKTQGSARQYPLERINVPTLLISAADDLYRTLSVARHAASVIPRAKLIEFPTGGHLLLGRANEVWPTVASFLQLQLNASRWGRTALAIATTRRTNRVSAPDRCGVTDNDEEGLRGPGRSVTCASASLQQRR